VLELFCCAVPCRAVLVLSWPHTHRITATPPHKQTTPPTTIQQTCVTTPQETDIMRKLQANRASSTDMGGSTINVGDYVNVIEMGAAARAGQLGNAKKERGGERVCVVCLTVCVSLGWGAGRARVVCVECCSAGRRQLLPPKH
jgi:hypothetical protein